MAEHRACVNALTSIYLVRKEFTAVQEEGVEVEVSLPTSVHEDRPMDFVKGVEEKGFRGNVEVGTGDGVFGTGAGKKKWRGGKKE